MDRIRVERIKNKLLEDPKSVLEHFNVEYRNIGNRLVGRCPCHKGSDNRTGFSLYLTGYPGTWNCFTRGCHEQYNSDMIGLVWGILSNRNDKFIPFPEVLDYCEQNIGIADYAEVDCDLVRLSKQLGMTVDKMEALTTKEYVEKTLEIPSPYFLKKGFSPDILKKFSIGDCWNPQKQMFGRAVCPIFDVDKDSVLGSAGRIIEEKPYLQKWKYSWKFKASSYFYGFWDALDSLSDKKTAILVEGQMDVVRLHEYGYRNTIGCFGAHITDNQVKLLNKTGIHNVVIFMDGDTAGFEAANRIESKCENYFNTKIISLKENTDPDQLTIEELRNIL